MTRTLHLGVIDIPHSNFKAGKKQKGSSGLTTGDLAEILEAKYKIMERFYLNNKDFIYGELTRSLEKSMESILMGSPTGSDPFIAGSAAIEDRMKLWLQNREMDRLGLIDPPVPTKASLMGTNHRLKHPYARRNPIRPSFIDTGQFVSSLKTWVD